MLSHSSANEVFVNSAEFKKVIVLHFEGELAYNRAENLSGFISKMVLYVLNSVFN